MKKISFIFLLALSIAFTGCNNEGSSKLGSDVVSNPKTADGTVDNSESARITFNKMQHDFGKILQGEKVKYSFKFTNTGGADLLISDVSTSCGCTVPSYPRHAIKKGESGKLEVIFDSKGKKGFQNKTITVLANTTPNKTTLRIKTNVLLSNKN